MLIIKLKVNYRTIRTIGIHNIYPEIVPSDFQGLCRYDVYDFGDFLIDMRKKPIGQVEHMRSDGADKLAAKALALVIEYNSDVDG